MASIRKQVEIDAPADEVWAAFRDIGNLHTRLVPGFVTACRMEGEDRIITFANGFVSREVIVDVDDSARRLAYSARSERLAHHNASFEVHHAGPVQCRVIWRADVLPAAAAEVVAAMMEQGCEAMRRHLSRR